jgi:hypothetical protein
VPAGTMNSTGRTGSHAAFAGTEIPTAHKAAIAPNAVCAVCFI